MVLQRLTADLETLVLEEEKLVFGQDRKCLVIWEIATEFFMDSKYEFEIKSYLHVVLCLLTPCKDSNLKETPNI